MVCGKYHLSPFFEQHLGQSANITEVSLKEQKKIKTKFSLILLVENMTYRILEKTTRNVFDLQLDINH